MQQLPFEIISLVIGENIVSYLALASTTKTFTKLMHTVMVYMFLEKEVGNGYACPRELSFDMAWNWFVMLKKPNRLCNIRKNATFLYHKELSADIMSFAGIKVVDDMILTHETISRSTVTHFSIPSIDIDLYKKDMIITYDANGATCSGAIYDDLTALRRDLMNNHNSIVHNMFDDSVFSRDQLKNLCALTDLIDISHICCSGDRCTMFEFYTNIGLFPDVCEKILTWYELHLDISVEFLRTFKNNPNHARRFFDIVYKDHISILDDNDEYCLRVHTPLVGTENMWDLLGYVVNNPAHYWAIPHAAKYFTPHAVRNYNISIMEDYWVNITKKCGL